MSFTKKDQTFKREIKYKVCSKCGKRRKIEEFTSTQGRVCGVCKRKAKRLKKQSGKNYQNKIKDSELRAIIVERDKSTCQWCGKKVTGGDCQMSHVLPKGMYPELRHDPLNVKILCYRCHLQKWHKNPIDANKWFEAKFPDRYKYLMEKKRNAGK